MSCEGTEPPPQTPQEQRNGAFRAPPPSPIATAQGIKSAGVNNEILSEFLEHTLRIPELSLPEPFIPFRGLPAFDLLSVRSREQRKATGRRLVQSAIEIGCFQVVNHGISRDLTVRAEEQSSRLFDLPVERKQLIVRSDRSRFGFEHIDAEGDGAAERNLSLQQTFWVDQNDNSMEKIIRKAWPEGFDNFSHAISEYTAALEKIASEVLEVIYENLSLDPYNLKELLGAENSSLLCLYSHEGSYKCPSSGICHSHSHVLSVHHHKGPSSFYVYADRGWTTFTLKPNTLVITMGNILRVWSNGLLKSVLGRAVTPGDKHFISMEFLYSPPSNICRYRSVGQLVKVSLVDQFLVTIILILLWNLFSCLRT